MNEWLARIKKDYRFRGEEITSLLVCVLFAAVIFSFKDWGEPFNFSTGFLHLFEVFLIALLAFFLHETAHKLIALKWGYKSEFKISWLGLTASLILAFVSGGNLAILLPGGLFLAHHIRYRLGEFRYGLNYNEMALVALIGPVTNLLLAALFQWGLTISPENYFLQKGFILNLTLAICTVLPLPTLDGFSAFFGSRGFYIFSAILIIVTGLLLLTFSLLPAILFAAVAGFLAWLVYFQKVEK